MQPHHTLMVKLEGKGNDRKIVDHKAIPNNEWAKYRRTGWEFASMDQVADYNAMMAEQAADAAQARLDRRAEEDEANRTGDGPVPKKSASKS